MSMIPLRIKRISPLAEIPRYQSDNAAGLDLHAAIETPITLQQGEIQLIPCGFQMAVPPGYEAQVRPRSGLAARFGISMPNAPGTIDADYRGEIKIAVINLGEKNYTVHRGDRIAQMVVKKVHQARLKEVDQLDETHRNSGGFGHTGR